MQLNAPVLMPFLHGMSSRNRLSSPEDTKAGTLQNRQPQTNTELHPNGRADCTYASPGSSCTQKQE